MVLSLSSPSPTPAGMKRHASPLEPPYRHPRPPPPPPGHGCDIPKDGGATLAAPAATPAEPAASKPSPRGDTGGTGEQAARGSKSNEAKKVDNAFRHQKKYLEKEPELLQHLEDLIKTHPRGSPIILEYRMHLGDCMRGAFQHRLPTWRHEENSNQRMGGRQRN